MIPAGEMIGKIHAAVDAHGVDAFARQYAAKDANAAQYLRDHAADARAMQLRFTDGRMYAAGRGEDSYKLGKEEYALQQMALTEEFDALIALGAVIRGETYHFEIVSNESARGITNVQLDTGIPIANGILTTEDEDQATARMAQKGADCAAVAVEMANLLREFGPK